MTNAEARMTKQDRHGGPFLSTLISRMNPGAPGMSRILLVDRNLCNPPSICDIRVLVSSFVIRASFVILVSSFVISRRAGIARCRRWESRVPEPP
jgi:hypothetical protein